MVPASTSQLAKMRLYNTTRGTSALISNCVTGTNTITLTADVPAGWATTDVITIASQTVSGGTVSWVDIEIASGPTNKTHMFLSLLINSATVGDGMFLHPFTASYSASKVKEHYAQVASQSIITEILQTITTNTFALAWKGTPVAIIVRESGYLA
jgi:hypothetical protein